MNAAFLGDVRKGMTRDSRVLMIPILPGWQGMECGQMVGLSEDLDEIDRAREVAEELGRVDVMFMVGNAGEIPWRDGYFDVAYVGGASTEEVKRVMKEGGAVHEWQREF
jgi:ubiquinone/menaquinone biosynthesis C-methylase UbiE